MKNKKRWVSILAGLLALLMVLGIVVSILPGYVSAAESSSAIREQIDALEEQKAQTQKQLDELESKLTQNQNEINEIAAQKDVIDQEIALLHQQIAAINEQISAYSTLIADKQEELVAAEATLAELSEQNKVRIRAMEENGTVSYWSVIFEANSFTDLLDRVSMIEEIAAADRRRLTEMSEAADLVAATKAELETQKAALEATRAELDETQATLEAKSAETEKLLASLVAKGEEFEALIDEGEEKQSNLMEEIAQKEKDYDAAKYREWLATSVPPTTTAPPTAATTKPATGNSGGTAGTGNTVSGITWLVPINYTAFTSAFGKREHPVYGGERFHYGVDLAAPKGTPIVATRSGVVTTTSYEHGGAGYYVVINHGDGYSSIYMHMTHYIVSPGQYVSAGQVIGYCGSTGASTGPHLHFGISYNGVYVNPANYIKI